MSGFLPETFSPSQKQVLRKKLKELHSLCMQREKYYYRYIYPKQTFPQFLQVHLKNNCNKYEFVFSEMVDFDRGSEKGTAVFFMQSGLPSNF